MTTPRTDNSNASQRALLPVASNGKQPLYLSLPDRRAGGTAEQLISPAFLLWVFQQWWKLGIPSGIALAGIVAAAVVYLHVPRYEAKAILTIEDTTPFVAYSKLSPVDKSRRYIQTQIELLRSPVVLDPVLARPEIASIEALKRQPDPVPALAENLAIKPLGGSELYNVSYISTVPKDAAAIVNAVLDEYMHYHLDDDSQRTQRVVDILEDERRRRAREVDRLRNRLIELTQEATGKNPYGASGKVGALLQSPIGSLFQTITELDLDREVLKAQKQCLLETKVGAKDPLESSGLLDIDVDNHAETHKRVDAIATIEAQLETMKADAVRYQKNPNVEASASYLALQKDLAQRKADLGKCKEQLRSMILAQRKEQNRFNRELEAAKLDEQLKVLEARRDVLAKRFTEQLSQQQTGEGKSVEVEFARAELAREETVFELIASRKLALQTETRAPARVKLTRNAPIPVVPIEPVPFKILFVACAASLLAPFGIALCKEVMIRRISDVEQLARESRLRILGEIAELPVRNMAISPGKVAGRLQRDAHVFAESINILRTNLAIVDDLRDHHVLAVMSASSGESKSSVTVSLAMSIANASGNPTLIIDGDLRSPDVAAMVKIKSQPGLFEVLSGTCELENAIQHVGDSNLYVLPAGRATRSTHHVVQIDKMEALLERLRTKFPTILIDTPPVLGAGESIVLARAADAVLLCSLSGTSKVKQIRMAVERLESAGANLAGAVLSGSSVRAYAYRYGYYPIENADEG